MVTRKRKLVAPEYPCFQVPEKNQVHEDGSTESVVRGRNGKKVTFTTPKGQKISASKSEVFDVLLNSAKSTRQPRIISEGICDLTRYELLSK
ncbi:hypothetical protein [Rosenbergiella epipactidis]|uniref:hypothetical protein n=1 Tax=Rosenbergiella epipactidis TaxID=1544694 RepID=UPI001F4DBB0F|nr:hypothetical protein [Rosenbergiella epipactidis]